MRRLGLLLLLAAAGLLLAAGPVAAADYVIKLGHVIAPSEPIHQAFERMAERVKERTKGRVEIQVYPNSQLGSNKDTYEQARMGAPVMAHIDPGYASELGDTDIAILGGPFLYDSWDQAKKIIASPLVQKVNENIRTRGSFRILSWGYYFGSRHVISDKGYPSPADIKGRKVRVPPNPMWVETFKSMGAVPTPLQWSEVYSGLSQGVVDAAEAPLSTLYGSKLFEVKKVVTLTGPLQGRDRRRHRRDLLPDAARRTSSRSSRKRRRRAGAGSRRSRIQKEDEYRQTLTKAGVTFVQADAEAYRKATAATYNAFPKWSPGLYDRVREVLK